MHFLPHLHDLEVQIDQETWNADGGAHLFRPLSMPALVKLDLSTTEAENADEISLYTQYLFSRSGMTLTHLDLQMVMIQALADARMMLHALPQLRHFSAGLCGIGDDAFFDLLRSDGPQDSPPLVPCLEELLIYDAEYLIVEEDFSQQVLDMVLSRWWSDEELVVVRPPVARWKEVRVV